MKLSSSSKSPETGSGGEVAHSDTVKASPVLERQRDTQEARLAVDKARLGFPSCCFPISARISPVVDDLDAERLLPPLPGYLPRQGQNSPEIRAAQATVQQQGFEIRSARAALLAFALVRLTSTG